MGYMHNIYICMYTHILGYMNGISWDICIEYEYNGRYSEI